MSHDILIALLKDVVEDMDFVGEYFKTLEN